jgi:polyhydroxyalkanoate synthase subunit PhaC
MRTGPRPLSAHIGLMASAFPPGGEGYAKAMTDMLAGIKKYQEHPYKRDMKPLKILWKKGSVSVGVAMRLKAGQPTLLLVPSMVNKAYILDLMKGRSLLRWLEGQGVNAALLDWGNPVVDNSLQDIDAAIDERLIPAIEFMVQQAIKNGGAPIHVLGYCMGGTLLAGAAKKAEASIRSLIFLAAPWDFHAGGQALLNRVKFWAPSAAPMINEKGHLPMDWMQTVFASLDPVYAAKKFAKFAAMDADSEESALFVAVEDWLNDGVDLPAALAQQPIDEWFLCNRPGLGQWVDATQISAPSLIITSRKDRLVEYETAAALRDKIPGAELLDSGFGHIGMMIGSNAIECTWKPIAEWVKKHDKQG